MSRSDLYQLAASLVLGILMFVGVIKIAALSADRERRERSRSGSDAERVRLRDQTAFDRGSTEGDKRKDKFGYCLYFFLLLLAFSLGSVFWIGGGMWISVSCFSHEEIDTSTRDIAWLCVGPVIVLIGWAVPLFGYRKSHRPLVWVVGAGFTVVFILVESIFLVDLLSCS